MSARNLSLPVAWLDRLDQRLVRFMQTHGVRLLRFAIAVVYIWFGGLKLINASPASELVVRTVFWLPRETFQDGNPLLPTLEGQYAIKNIVVITAGLVIGSTVRRSAR